MKPDWAGLIRKARDASRLSQDALARATGLTARGIGHYEQGTREPDLLCLIRIILAVDEAQQLALVKHLPPEVWKLAVRLSEIADLDNMRGLDSSAILEEVLRSEPAVSSPRSSPISRMSQVEQTPIARKVYERGHRAPRRKSHHSKG